LKNKQVNKNGHETPIDKSLNQMPKSLGDLKKKLKPEIINSVLVADKKMSLKPEIKNITFLQWGHSSLWKEKKCLQSR